MQNQDNSHTTMTDATEIQLDAKSVADYIRRAASGKLTAEETRLGTSHREMAGGTITSGDTGAFD